MSCEPLIVCSWLQPLRGAKIGPLDAALSPPTKACPNAQQLPVSRLLRFPNWAARLATLPLRRDAGISDQQWITSWVMLLKLLRLRWPLTRFLQKMIANCLALIKGSTGTPAKTTGEAIFKRPKKCTLTLHCFLALKNGMQCCSRPDGAGLWLRCRFPLVILPKSDGT